MRKFPPRVPRWALWISSAITFFAIVMLVLAIVLGVRAGQEQLTLKRRQQVSTILEQAFTFHNQGRVEAARVAYEEVLLLDPDNSAAAEALNHLRTLDNSALGNSALSVETTPAFTPPIADTEGDVAPAALPTSTGSAPAASPVAPPTAAATTTGPTASTAMLADAEQLLAAGRWSDAVDELVALQGRDPTFQTTAVADLLFDAYVNLAWEKDNQNRLQEAVDLFDAALAIRNDATIRAERALVANYRDAITYAGADWERALTALDTIYAVEPNYRDVAERLQEALLARGEQLALDDGWCDAADLLDRSIAIGITPGVVLQRDEYQEACETDGASLAEATDDDEATPGTGTTTTPTATRESPTAGTTNPGTLSSGSILYSALDAATGRSRIMSQPVGSSGAATLLRDNAAQPALRQDGVRLLYRNLRNDMAGISAWDVNTDLLLRFTQYAEDTSPSWNGVGNRFVFASNREGDRLWRIYASWAEADGETTTLSIGEAPAWNPTADQIAFRGCDNSGNRCGLWLINGSGGSRSPLTSVTADTRPAWSPDGRYVVFMSNGRDGNFELYRVDANGGQVLRLTESNAADLLPTVSPDGRWVAFVSDRSNGWALWGVPLAGGDPVQIAPLSGTLGSWTEQSLQWVP